MSVSTAELIKTLNDRAVDLLLPTDPLYAPIFGIRGKLEDEIFQVSKEFNLELISRIQDLMSEVKALQADQGETMSAADAADLRFLKYALEGFMEQVGVPGEVGYSLELGENHMSGNLMNLEMGYTMYQPVATKEDFANYVTRLSKLPSRFNDIISNFRHGIARGEGKEDLEAVAAAMPMAKAEEAKNVMGDEKFMVKSIVENVFPSFGKMKTFLEEEYLPHARTHPGIYGLEGYKEFLFSFLFLLFSGLRSLHLPQHHGPLQSRRNPRLGLQEVTRISTLMEQAKTACGFTGTVKEFQTALNDRTLFPDLYFDNPDDVIPYYKTIMERAEIGMKDYFHAFPKFKCVIDGMPSYMEQQAPLAFYAPGTPEKAGTFRWLFEKEGQHVIRKFVMETAYAEGYGLYCEWLGEEMGFYTNPFDYFGRLECEMQRACRLVVDSGLHAMGWSIDQGVEFMASHLSLPREELLTEMKELRRFAEKELGDRFDVKGFHGVLVDDGSMPLEALGEAVEAWVAKRKAEE
ncbi:hypothetical protein BC829DRAFT_436445 [Chytridium lagenaria]|nr:hypothetical protein BC829DRAFT_436445 [Chytridium lagenaria]